jgi:hypothetical protein
MPAFADGVEMCRFLLPGDVTRSRTFYKFVRGVNGKRETNMKDDEDYPASYLLYVSITLVAIALVAVTAFFFLL